MKHLMLMLSMLASSTMFAEKYTKEVAEKDINSIPQCEDQNQNSEECKQIKQEIKEFFDALEKGTDSFSNNYYDQPFFKEVIDEMLSKVNKKELLPSEYLEKPEEYKNKIKALFEPCYHERSSAALIQTYLHLRQSTVKNISFKNFVAEVISEEPFLYISKYDAQVVARKLEKK